MSQRIINVRIRPGRVLVLVNKDGDWKDLLLAFKLFSRIWGGRFGQILPVDPAECDGLTAFRLGEIKPEFVYGIGLDDMYWVKEIHRVCQPRVYNPLNPELIEGIRQHHPASHIIIDHALLHLIQTRDRQGSRKRSLRLISCEELSPWSAYCAAMFGCHYQNMRSDFYDSESSFNANTTPVFVDLVTEFVKECQQSWLDVTGHGLSTIGSNCGILSPTIVLVESLVSDLSLFWNLHTQSETNIPAWIIPIPFESVTDTTILEGLRNWLLAFQPYGQKPNYCLVTSSSVEEANCQDLCNKLQKMLSGTPIEYVDYERPSNRIPNTIPYEYETPWPVEIRNRKLTVEPPGPKMFENLDSSQAWFVDLHKDVKTGRAVAELQLPSSPVVFETLNGPCPPVYDMAIIARTGYGRDCLNIYCSGRNEVVNIYLPTDEEVLGESLRECGVELVPDEKRSSYLPVIKRFGDLMSAALNLSGQRREILTTLAKSTKTVPELKGTCALGRGEISGETYVQRIEPILRIQNDRMRRITERRFLEYIRHSSPENLRVQSILEHWADKQILTRQWRIGPCGRCKQKYFIPSLNIQRRVICINCGHRISLPPEVPIGYTLHHTVRHAIEEGIIPVIQTGRFLRNLTNQGFFWLPGIKYRIDSKQGDIDILACCDGHLVFCECKTLETTLHDSNLWNNIVGQFLETASLAKKCGGSLAVLAAYVETFPKQVVEKLDDAFRDSMPYLLLNKNDLEVGHRENEIGWLRINDLISQPFPDPSRERPENPRTINMGWGTYTR